MLKGELVAEILKGAWRQRPPEFNSDAASLAEVAPLLLGSGAGALGWRRVSNSKLRNSPAGDELRNAYLHHRLFARVFERHVALAVEAFRQANIEPLLVKGYAVARMYAELGLRPYGDLDFCVRPNEFEKAERVAATLAAEGVRIDLQKGDGQFGFARV